MVVRVLRRFTDAGMAPLSRRLDQIDLGATSEFEDLLDDPRLTEVVAEDITVQIRPLADRMDASAYLDPIVTAARAVLPDVLRDRGLWTWLAIAWMDHLAPIEGGRRKLKERARWVLEAENWQRYYRHLLAGPYFIYNVHRDDPERARALLLNPVNKPGEVVEQFASRQDLVRARGVMGAVTALYVGNAGQFKRGAAGKDTPGGARPEFDT